MGHGINYISSVTPEMVDKLGDINFNLVEFLLLLETVTCTLKN